ncbi:MAG TPA: YdeI/OmpD-associated family protein [Polyangia bacterium]|nr:YdeI/OmpD-associated family protein [Polyangia bacterium]
MAAVEVDPGKVREFRDERAFEAWLRKNWNREQEVWIKLHKVSSGLPSITPKEAIDVCLCWGWIDGIRKGYDENSFLQRYTPRTKKSVWSQINIANVERLTQQRRMQPPGLAQVEAAKADGRWAAAYRMSKSEPPPDLMAAIRADRDALATYEGLSAQNRFSLTFRTLAVKSAEARQRRIAGFVEMLRQGKTIHPNGKRTRVSERRSPARPR